MFSREKHVVSGLVEYKRGHMYFVSIDYGTVNPFAVGIFDFDGRKSTMIKEVHYSGRESGVRKDNEEYYKMMDDAIGSLPVESITVDPSAAGFIETIKKSAQYIVKGADNDVLTGIQEVKKYLNYELLQIHDSCVETIKEFEAYAWDDKTGGDTVIKENDHHMDSIRYYIYGVARMYNRWVCLLYTSRCV